MGRTRDGVQVHENPRNAPFRNEAPETLQVLEHHDPGRAQGKQVPHRRRTTHAEHQLLLILPRLPGTRGSAPRRLRCVVLAIGHRELPAKEGGYPLTSRSSPASFYDRTPRIRSLRFRNFCLVTAVRSRAVVTFLGADSSLWTGFSRDFARILGPGPPEGGNRGCRPAARLHRHRGDLERRGIDAECRNLVF